MWKTSMSRNCYTWSEKRSFPTKIYLKRIFRYHQDLPIFIVNIFKGFELYGHKIYYSLIKMNMNEAGTIAEITSLADREKRTRFLSSLFLSMSNRPSDRWNADDAFETLLRFVGTYFGYSTWHCSIIAVGNKALMTYLLVDRRLCRRCALWWYDLLAQCYWCKQCRINLLTYLLHGAESFLRS